MGAPRTRRVSSVEYYLDKTFRLFFRENFEPVRVLPDLTIMRRGAEIEKIEGRYFLKLTDSQSEKFYIESQKGKVFFTSHELIFYYPPDSMVGKISGDDDAPLFIEVFLNNHTITGLDYPFASPVTIQGVEKCENVDIPRINN